MKAPIGDPRKLARTGPIIPAFQQFCDEVRVIRDESARNEGGKVATYIPELAAVPQDAFGVALTTIDGDSFGIGDTDVPFSVQSCTKPINYCIALEEHGIDAFHAFVGREPSGRGFSELTLNSDEKPHNPMINAGAIATCSLIRRQGSMDERFAFVLDRWSRLAGGGEATIDEAVYRSESQTADRNFALGYFMKEKKVFPPGTDLLETLDFYFRCCAIQSTCSKMAVIAATLANGGVCPTTGVRLFAPETVRACLSLMSSCGLYDFSGEFAFTIGLPAKSGVSGALVIVVPNVMGICTWAPRIDAHGNSVRGVEFCRRFVNRFNFHVYDDLFAALESKVDPRRPSLMPRQPG